MTLAFGNLLFFGALLTLVIPIFKTVDGSYLISSATRPPRLKFHAEEKYAENGTPSEIEARNLYRRAPIIRDFAEDGKKNSRKSSWLYDKRNSFFNSLKPTARNFVLKNHGHYGAVPRNKRNKFDDAYSEIDYDFAPQDIPELDTNSIIPEENPKSSKNLNYYPYRLKRPFEVPQIDTPFIFVYCYSSLERLGKKKKSKIM
ncbi:hypothetical protein PGB90_001892 [Kerria lacca]